MAIVECPSLSCTTFGGSSRPPVGATVNAPARIKVTQRMHTGRFRCEQRLAIFVSGLFALTRRTQEPSRQQQTGRNEAEANDIIEIFDFSFAVGKTRSSLPFGAFEFPLPERIKDQWRQGDVLFARAGFGAPEFLIFVGAFAGHTDHAWLDRHWADAGPAIPKRAGR